MRSDHISYADLCGPVLYRAQLIVNTTPVGMFPDTELVRIFPMNLSQASIFYMI